MKNLLFLIACAFVFVFVYPVSAQESDRDHGIALYRSGNYSEAESALRKAIEADKRDGPAWRFLGAALVKLGKEDEALKAFQQSGLDPKSFAEERKKYDPPLKILRKPPARYTAEARRRGIEGEITVMAEMRSDGKVGFVFPLRTLKGGLTENALKSAREIRFEPAVQNGQPVTTIQLMSYNFDLY